MLFDHEKLNVYKLAIRFVVLADDISRSVPSGRAHLRDQLQRASTSIAFNIAEGAGEYARKEKARFYRIAKRSGTESASILDVCRELKLAERQKLDRGRGLLLSIVSMLTKMVHSRNGAGQGHAQGHAQGTTSLHRP